MTYVNFWHWAEHHPDRIAIGEVDGSKVTFGELAERAHRTANALIALGMKPGDAVATLLRNRSECIELFLAALNCGWYYVPINHHGTAADTGYVVENSEAKAVFVDAEFAGLGTTALDSIGFPADRRFSVTQAAGFTTMEQLRAGQATERPRGYPAGQVMQYTSGTTGRPKGVRRPIESSSADDLVGSMSWLLRTFGIAPGDGVHLVTSPLYHSAVHSISTAALHLGQSIEMMERWTAQDCLVRIERDRVTSTHMVATHFHRLLQLPEAVRQAADVSSLRHVIHGAVPTPVDEKRRMIEWWGPVIFEYYGSSEVGGTIVTSQEWMERPGTVGRPFTISEVKILDDEGNELGPNQVGKIWMRQGDQKFSYYKDPEKTARSVKGQFIHVGDHGYVDEDGYLFLSGRDAEIIISGGVNIYPAAIDACLLNHPAVHDCGVIGAPNPEFGEEVKAIVCLNPGWAADDATAQQLIEHCRAHLSRLMVPRSVDFVDELPRDPNGKLQKKKLRDTYWVQLERAL
ncbi:MAG: AMP-binding protein [Erythrobacter sp.]